MLSQLKLAKEGWGGFFSEKSKTTPAETQLIRTKL